MNPKPFASLNHLTVPCAMTCPLSVLWSLGSGDPGSDRRGAARCTPSRGLIPVGRGASQNCMSQVSLDHAQLLALLGRREARGSPPPPRPAPARALAGEASE